MGTKRTLASEVKTLSHDAKQGPILDLFCGMCAVGSILAEDRQVWSNDLQHFASSVAEASFCSTQQPQEAIAAFDTMRPFIEANTHDLMEIFATTVEIEDFSIRSRDVVVLQKLFTKRLEIANAHQESRFVYDLFSIRFGSTYFSLRQCIEIDSLVYAIDKVFSPDREQHRWMKIALAIAMSRCTSSTGHFAQPLKPNLSNVKKVVSQRNRKVSHEFVSALDRLHAKGSRNWRQRNRVYRKDACFLLDALQDEKRRPSLIYADPPYTKDQYSRYYHIYETLMLYDHPASAGTGSYRSDRKVSEYCLATKVELVIDELIRRSRSLRCDLILSYPTNGLLDQSRIRIPEFMAKHYKRQPKVLQRTHRHSTMGASKGSAKHEVIEVLYMAQMS